jgi:Fe-S-cluster containining protein
MDSTGTEGLYFHCLEGCGLCCLCQPELIGKENKRFSKDPDLKKGITRVSVTGPKGRNYSLKLKDDKGSCFFLRDRRCGIYNDRPTYCRLFPIHFHLGERIQVVVNKSCRGINSQQIGDPVSDVADECLSLAKKGGLLKGLDKVELMYQQFYDNYIQGSSELLPDNLKTHIIPLLEENWFQNFVKRSLAYSSSEGNIPIDLKTLGPFLVELGSPDVLDAALEGAADTFLDDDLTKLPVWTDGELNWTVCRITGPNVEQCVMGDDGGLKIVKKVALEKVGLRKFGPGVEEIFQAYSKRVIELDLTYGYAAYLKSITEDDDPFIKVYLGALGTILLDLWWRTSLLAALSDEELITEEIAREGIIAYDMDYLDLPSIGGFL